MKKLIALLMLATTVAVGDVIDVRVIPIGGAEPMTDEIRDATGTVIGTQAVYKTERTFDFETMTLNLTPTTNPVMRARTRQEWVFKYDCDTYTVTPTEVLRPGRDAIARGKVLGMLRWMGWNGTSTNVVWDGRSASIATISKRVADIVDYVESSPGSPRSKRASLPTKSMILRDVFADITE